MRHSLMWRQRVLSVVLLFVVAHISATMEQEDACPPSSCGKITNITHPFRLKGDPIGCGDKRYELACENDVTVLYLYWGKYNVEAINYDNFTVRVVDPGLQQQNCSSLPRYFLSLTNFSDAIYYYNTTDPYQASYGLHYWREFLFHHIVLLNCSHPVADNHKYVNTASCVNGQSKSKGYIYAIAGDLKAEDFEVGCHVKVVTPTSWWGLDTDTDRDTYSYTTILESLLYGFEISWMARACEDKCEQNRHCFSSSSNYELYCAQGNSLLEILQDTIFYVLEVEFLFCAGKFFIGLLPFIVFFIYKWRKRHLSVYENIENYLQQNSLTTIGYSYKEIKKMSKGFKDKLGEGGYGSVFKGKLRSGPFVAIKVLRKSKGKGQDFMSEIATIGRIHHQNVVQLIGYCVEDSKRALIYEFMSNGSLDKLIFSKNENIHLSYDQIYNISIGIARGISYLHHGCEMKILHFDIKPHNILLDEKFTPKVSDFGLAKLYPIDDDIVTMTAARGTIGYMAPELFYKNIGRISHKADVYSFGMLLMEMASKRKNLNPHVEHSSQLYFPFWIYNQLGKEKDIEMEDVTEEEKKIAKKLIIVSLWCIQLKPDDRPSMNIVVEMLEGNLESLEIPPKPLLYPHETMEEDQKIYSSQTTTIDTISSSGYSVDTTTDLMVSDVKTQYSLKNYTS
ncbi:hypothetical protein Fmac_032055 [Flemingia macrophylla]|uniref:Protein kinase domain-containing protein n=1 Tax=Flemingia macrophylla TaxID=520843 RepID=A0ABD1L3U1_9FABA